LSETLDAIQALVACGEVQVSAHGYEELAADNVLVADVVWGIPHGRTSPAVVVTAYRPDPAKWDETWQKRRT
jgi:hypothetical protein